MIISEFYIALIIGLTVSVIFSEITGVATGGIIVPSYLALVFDSPDVLMTIYLVALSTFLIIEHVMPRFVVLFGRRRFVATIFIALLLKLVLEMFYPYLPFSVFLFRGIGVLVPALIANTFAKQGVRLTLFSTLFVTLIVFVLLNLLYYL